MKAKTCISLSLLNFGTENETGKLEQVLTVLEMPRNTAWNANKCGKLTILKIDGKFHYQTDLKTPKIAIANCQIANAKR